jgi:transcriptional regulator with XRE-family HTH domain
MDFGTRIAAARLAANLTQAELGERVGLSQKTINGYEGEGRQPKLGAFVRIALATNTTPEWLAFGHVCGHSGDDDGNRVI